MTIVTVMKDFMSLIININLSSFIIMHPDMGFITTKKGRN